VERGDWNRKHGEAGPLFGVEPNRFLAAEAAGLPPGRALDVACGAGRNAVWLAERGWTVTGVDFSGVALAHARRLAEARGVEVEWVDGDLRGWQPPAEYDLVAMLYLHVPANERRAVLSRAVASLAPGGALLVVGHHSDNIEHGSGGPKDPRVLYSAEDVAADLGGLELEKAGAVPRPVEGERDAIDVLVRARRLD
jgi:SAM-dependent methyltransferase